MRRATFRAALALVCLAEAGEASSAESAPVADWTGVLSALTPAQQSFVSDTESLRRFGLTERRIHALLIGRDTVSIKKAVAAMIAALEAAKFAPPPVPALVDGTNPLAPADALGYVPLNPQAGDFNRETVLRPALLDENPRSPGPFSVKRYVRDRGGVPTFAGAPVALRKEDLIAGKVDVAFVGVPLNMGSGWRDSQSAPDAMRAMQGISGFDVGTGIDPAIELTLADYGNLNVDIWSTERTLEHVRSIIAEVAATGAIPFVVGGDHSVMIATVGAMSAKYGPDQLSVVHLDAHANAARDQAHYVSDAQAVAQLIKADVLRGRNLLQVGIRGGDATAADLAWLREQGVIRHSMADVESHGWDKVASLVLQQLHGSAGKLYVSFDMSVLDPSYGVGAGRPAANGLTMREVAPFVQRLCADNDVVGFEILDVAPYLDASYSTVLNANSILHACLTGIAVRRGTKAPEP